MRNAVTDLRALRRAIDSNVLGSGPEVVASEDTKPDSHVFRIVNVKLRRGVVYGKQLSTCKWVEIREWDTF